MDLSKYIYLDNNATTYMPKEVTLEMLKWCNQGNASAGYSLAKNSRNMMEEFRLSIGKLCSIDTCCPEERDQASDGFAKCDINRYKIIFTSGASEGNSMILSGVINAFADAKGTIPHVVMGATEHKGLITHAHTLEDRKVATFTFVQPAATGHTLPEDISNAIRPNTCLICVMSANNETGAINDVEAIGAIAHSRGIIYHCDTVQSFGKSPIKPLKCGVDSFCISFHKFYGPPGVGILAIKQKFLLGYNLQPIIFGTQNEGYRGGTENLPGIGAAFAALKYNFTNRAAKNQRLLLLKGRLIVGLAACFPLRTFNEYTEEGPPVEIIVFSAIRDTNGKINIDPDLYLCNTIFISIVKRKGEFICNTKIKKFLEERSIIISVGSACNTASSKASHVLYSLGADQYIRKGALRISLGDMTSNRDVDLCVNAIREAVKAQM